MVAEAGLELAAFNISPFNPSIFSIISAFLVSFPAVSPCSEMAKGKK